MFVSSFQNVSFMLEIPTISHMFLGAKMNGFQFLKYPSRISRTKNWVSKNGIFAFGFLEKYVGDDVDGFAFGFLWNIWYLQGRAHSSSLMAPSSLNINFL
nr:G-type lectin S-receptor-like serine/threonine-protein kinase SD3-1 isoform X1 [Ipomoea trifida]